MQQELLPLFPLQLVLFPNTPLPLHIFEERYKEMIGDVLRHSKEFGVIQAGERGIVNTGCTALVEQVVKKYSDGRMDILTRGRRRFEILLLNDEKPYLRGAVDFFDDEDAEPPTPEAQQRAREGFDALRGLMDGEFDDPETTDPQLSFRLAQPVSDLEFRQVLLATRSEAERMKRLADYLPACVERERAIAHMKNIAPRNGYGKRPPGL